MEECYRDHRVSAFLIDAPHASHTHEKLKIFTALSGGEKKNKQDVAPGVSMHEHLTLKLACVEGMQIQR